MEFPKDQLLISIKDNKIELSLADADIFMESLLKRTEYIFVKKVEKSDGKFNYRDFLLSIYRMGYSDGWNDLANNLPTL